MRNSLDYGKIPHSKLTLSLKEVKHFLDLVYKKQFEYGEKFSKGKTPYGIILPARIHLVLQKWWALPENQKWAAIAPNSEMRFKAERLFGMKMFATTGDEISFILDYDEIISWVIWEKENEQ